MGSNSSKQVGNIDDEDHASIPTPTNKQQPPQQFANSVPVQHSPAQSQYSQQPQPQSQPQPQPQPQPQSSFNNNVNNSSYYQQPQSQQQTSFPSNMGSTASNNNLNDSMMGSSYGASNMPKFNSAPSVAPSQGIGSVAPAFNNAKAKEELTIEQLKEKYGKQFDIVQKKIVDDMIKNKSPHLTPESKKQTQIQKLANLALNKELIMARHFTADALKKYDYHPNKANKNFLKVFFIVSDLESWHHIPYFARFLLTPLEPKCGYVHTALQIGPWIFHWFDNSMVYIDAANSSKCLLSLSAGESIQMSDTAKFEGLIDRIIHWNTQVTYSEYSNNCQSFTFDLLKAIGLHDEFKGCIGTYFKGLKKGGVIECKYTNPFNNETVIFKNHNQLDKYVIEMMIVFANQRNLAYNTLEEKINVVKQFAQEYNEDYALLKAFDRGYWLRFNKFKNMQNTYKTRATNLEEQRRNYQLQHGQLPPVSAQENKYLQQAAELQPKIDECNCYYENNLLFCPFGDPLTSLSIPQPVNVDDFDQNAQQAQQQ